MNSSRMLFTCAAFVAALIGCKSPPATEVEVPETTVESAKPPAPQPNPGVTVSAPDDVARAPADATRTGSGLAFRVLKAGTGDKHPGDLDVVTVVYTGWTSDGAMFDTTLKQGEPAEFGVNRVFPGLGEAIRQLVAGEKARFWIPGKLAYGEKGSEPNRVPGPPKGMLVFDIELVSLEDGPTPHPTPKDVAAVPDHATKSGSGLASIVLKKGVGSEHPEGESVVTLNYTAWTADGTVVDSTGVSGTSPGVPLSAVMPGLREGVQQMVAGEERRLWIPSKLAYEETPGRPQGTIVVDVELVEIRP